MKARAYRSGFTVVECLITLAVLSILQALALPSLSFLRDRALQLHTVDQLETAVAAARHFSVNNGTTVTLCGWSGPPGSVALQATDFPRCGEDYAKGVSIWVLETFGWRLYRVWEWEQRTVTNRSGSRLVSEHVVFSERGLAHRNMTWSTCANGANLSLVLNRVGRPSRRMGWGSC
ncbi:prepilin-type N-terminal cleavage/methylation domain-containing protein [Candidatus Paraluminiphilus aquimaris]|uniref:Prepilin-type N-terminal cleavage/methylation domain-containing protein n=1 Tax=Candidatus Paraluminiphilus aquimaris TaxID=2518994 RepID=A0ABY6Q7Q9_9GAMM|nr:prepilin-type N-terminal cleavage/methylation domain-containing protein [Candidatus Paraluminiphilus aquimaris]UZP74266.1 prepilin-type N-terminal cleavage/methylation domain-containing protein [Candidatus Paraluminiphilus aquimaris]